MNAWLIDHCRAKARYTAIATGYNLGAAAFAGTGPIIATQLVRRSESYGRGWMSEHDKTKLSRPFRSSVVPVTHTRLCMVLQRCSRPWVGTCLAWRY